MKTITWLVILALSLAGCAINLTATATNPTSRKATIKAYWHRDSLPVWEGYTFEEIDGKTIMGPLFGDAEKATYEILPGDKTFLIGAIFNKGDGPKQTQIPMKAAIKEGHTYQLRGKVQDKLVSVWLEDATTSEKVSEPASGEWRNKPIIIVY